MKNRLKQDFASYKIYPMTALIAIELLMSFTFLGYIHIPPISITFAYIPILVAACFLGVKESVIIGAVFGLASMYKASAYYVMTLDKAFSPLASGYPLQSIMLSVGTRMLFGLIIGLIFKLIKNKKYFYPATCIICVIAPKVHSFLVFSAMGILFPQLGYSCKNAFSVGISDIIAALLCLATILIFFALYKNRHIRKFYTYIVKSERLPYAKHNLPRIWVTFMLFVLIACVCSTVYFSQRMSYMLTTYGFNLSSNTEYDLMHLQLQFLIAIFSLFVIMVLSMLVVYKYISYREYIDGLDDLTKIMGRKMFLKHCEALQKNSSLTSKDGWFIFADVDYFKSINDTFGHPTGDSVLKEFADKLNNVFGEYGYIGRMGGDEFAVIIDKPLTDTELKECLDNFLSGIADILESSHKITSSIGACRFSYPVDMEDLYSQADKILYEAKNQGRSCYVIKTYNANNDL